jgi:hypothetical protein
VLAGSSVLLLAFKFGSAQVGAQDAAGRPNRNAAAGAASTDASVDGKWPDETNTGVPKNIELRRSGSLVISTPGTTVSDLDIDGDVVIDASDVTLMQSRVRAATGFFDVVRIKRGLTGVVIRDCEIDGVGTDNEGINGIRGTGTFLRNNIHHVENGITLDGNDAVIQHNYIHDLEASGSPHYDGIQIDGGISNVTITHNSVINSYDQTAAIMIDNYFGPISNISVDNNLLVGGGYTVYSDGRFAGGAIAGVSITNNRMGKGRAGYRMFGMNVPIWRGNVDHKTGRDLGSR